MKSKKGKSTPLPALYFKESVAQPGQDLVISEEPLQMFVDEECIGITLRTPGDDLSLIIGYLFSQGAIQSVDQLKDYQLNHEEGKIELSFYNPVHLPRRTNLFIHSGCSSCGQENLHQQALETPYSPPSLSNAVLTPDKLYELGETFMKSSDCFKITGGSHSAAILTLGGEFLAIGEDVGRHNAVDKCIGKLLLEDKLPLKKHCLFLSGRAGFELVHKAAMASIPLVFSLGAPSSSSIELARRAQITLVGFLKSNRFNVYSVNERILHDSRPK